jgi:L-ribulose-5-phosphate 3-epimerase
VTTRLAIRSVVQTQVEGAGAVAMKGAYTPIGAARQASAAAGSVAPVPNAIACTTANFVARETRWAMHGWGHGDRVTNEAFAPRATYGRKLDELFAAVRGLGYDTIDLWGAHLNPDWATDAHVEIAQAALERHGLTVSTYAAWVGPSNIEHACELALAVGTSVIGAGFSGQPDKIAPVLAKYDGRLAVENHPERSPGEVLEKIERGGGQFGATVDTGWWATHGYDAPQAIEELAPHLLHVHLKDVRAPGEPHETCRWGEGIVPIDACIDTLRRVGYGGAIAVEHEPETVDPSDDLRAMREELAARLA